MADLFQVIVVAATAAVSGGGAAFITAAIQSNSKRAETVANNEAKLKVHGDDLLLKIMETAQSQVDSLSDQLAAKAGVETEVLLLRENVAEAMAYMRTLIAARRDGDDRAWDRAERAALQWITQMQRTFDARGAMRQEQQISESARSIAARAVAHGIKGDGE